MYKLLPWRCSGSVLAVVVALAVYADEFEVLTDIVLPNHLVVRYLPLILITVLVVIFGPTGRWAPWRWIWRLLPFLNRFVFPDLNGVWLGDTRSNWPTIKKMLDAAQADHGITQSELYATPEQADALAVEIKASLFKVQITAGLSNTNGRSHSFIVRPRKDAQGNVHLTYVYAQDTPNPVSTDVETHLGAADLEFELDDLEGAEGVYWTRRNWKTGFNTAGRLELRRIKAHKDKGKSLREYAAEERERITGS